MRYAFPYVLKLQWLSQHAHCLEGRSSISLLNPSAQTGPATSISLSAGSLWGLTPFCGAAPKEACKMSMSESLCKTDLNMLSVAAARRTTVRIL